MEREEEIPKIMYNYLSSGTASAKYLFLIA